MIKGQNQRGITSLSEYVITLSLVVVVVVGMTTYFQRTLQGRMRDTRHYAMSNLREACQDSNCVGKNEIGEGYEPYYLQSNTEVQANSVVHKGLKGSTRGSAGEFISREAFNRQSQGQSTQLPPMNAANDQVLGKE